MIEEEKINQEIDSLDYILQTGPNRTYSVEMVDFPTDERSTKAIPRDQENKLFRRKIQDMITKTHPHAIRVCILEKNNVVARKIIRIKDEQRVVAFGEKPGSLEPVEKTPGRFYDEDTVNLLKRQVSDLSGLMEKSGEERHQMLLSGLNDLRKEHEVENLKRDHQTAQKDWDRLRVSMEQEIEELNEEIFDIEQQNEGLTAKVDALHDKIDRYHQIGILAGAGLGIVKSGMDPTNLIQLAGLFIGGNNPSDILNALPGEAKKEAEPEKSEGKPNQEGLAGGDEALQRKGNEAAIFQWMKGLAYKDYLRFANIVNAIMVQPEITEMFLRLVLRSEKKAEPEAETTAEEGQ